MTASAMRPRLEKEHFMFFSNLGRIVDRIYPKMMSQSIFGRGLLTQKPPPAIWIRYFRSSPQKNRATVPGPVWLPMVVPT